MLTYLKDLNPFPGDGDIKLEPIEHKYSFRVPKNPSSSSESAAAVGGAEQDEEWITENVMSVSEFLKQYFPPFTPFAAICTAKSVNKRFKYWYLNRHELPNPRVLTPQFDGPLWPEKYDMFVPISVFGRIAAGESLERIREDVPWLELPAPLGVATIDYISTSWTRAGTRLHLDIERFLNKMPSPTPDVPEWKQVMRFIQDHSSTYTWVRTEMPVMLRSLRLCGTIDLLARRQDGKYVLIDHKNSKHIKRLRAEDGDIKEKAMMLAPFDFERACKRLFYYLQQSVYQLMCMRHSGVPVEEMFLVVYHPSNPSYIKIRVPDLKEYRRLFQTFVGALHKRKLYVDTIPSSVAKRQRIADEEEEEEREEEAQGEEETTSRKRLKQEL